MFTEGVGDSFLHVQEEVYIWEEWSTSVNQAFYSYCPSHLILTNSVKWVWSLIHLFLKNQRCGTTEYSVKFWVSANSICLAKALSPFLLCCFTLFYADILCGPEGWNLKVQGRALIRSGNRRSSLHVGHSQGTLWDCMRTYGSWVKSCQIPYRHFVLSMGISH